MSGFSFGTSTNTSGGGFSFGNVAAKPVATSGMTLGSATSGFSFASPATTTSAPTLGFSLPTASAAATTATTATTGFSFATPTASSAPSLTIGGIKPMTTATSTPLQNPLPTSLASLSTATTTSSTLSLGGAAPQTMSVRQLEERMNKWLVELKEEEERFVRQAEHVNTWDQILQNGHDQVQELKGTLYKVKTDQARLDAELDFIRSQQDEIERLLEPLENAVISTPANQLHQGDRQRDHMYHLAQNLDGQLRSMSTDLGKVIEHLNSNEKSLPANDPVGMVARILSAHMDTLKWLDINSKTLAEKLDAMSKISGESKKN